jgi:spore germination protein
MRAVLDVVLLLGLISQGALRAQSAGRPPHLVAYYVPYDATSWQSLQAHPESIDTVAAQWVTIDACGNLSSREDDTLKQFAHAHGLKIVPSLLTLSGWLNHRILGDPDVAANAIEQIVAYTVDEGYHGFDLDLEAVEAGDRDALSAFVTTLASALHTHDKQLMLAVPAKDRDVRVGWAGAYDYAALGAAADLVTIMAYEYRGPFSGPGSVAPYAWVDRVLAYTTQVIPREKVLLGLAFYGYDWNTTSGGARPLGYPQFAAMAEQYGVPIEFDAEAQSAAFSYEVLGDVPAPLVNMRPPVAHAIRFRQAPRRVFASRRRSFRYWGMPTCRPSPT